MSGQWLEELYTAVRRYLEQQRPRERVKEIREQLQFVREALETNLPCLRFYLEWATGGGAILVALRRSDRLHLFRDLTLWLGSPSVAQCGQRRFGRAVPNGGVTGAKQRPEGAPLPLRTPRFAAFYSTRADSTKWATRRGQARVQSRGLAHGHQLRPI
jgi:hypothetical protein